MTTATELRCAGCGCEGHAPVIVFDRAKPPPGAVLRPVFGWHPDGRPALLCRECRDKLAQPKRRRARR